MGKHEYPSKKVWISRNIFGILHVHTISFSLKIKWESTKMKKWSILFAIASLLVVAGCGDDNNNGNEENLPRCGNGIIEGTEQCDDSNHLNNDGCNDKCEIETCPMINSACDGSQIETMCCDGEIYACMHDFWVPTECYTKCYADECDIICKAETEHYPTGGCQYRFSSQSVCNDGFISFPHTSSSSCEFLLSMCGNGIVEEIYEQCDDGNTVDGDGCSAVCELEENQSSDSSVPKAGDRCSADDDGLRVCGQNNSLLECLDGVYELVESCSAKGTDYYCDALVDEEFVACVKSCTAEQEGQVIGYDGCLFGYVDVTQCQRGVSGKFGAFGGMGGENVCAPDGTKMVSCVNEESDEIKETPCAGGCTMHWDDDLSEYISECK